MTSKKNSTNSLKQWVAKIKRYEYELPRLYEKLEYLKIKSIGYNSPSFEPRLNSSGSNGYKGIDYWLVKIDECKRKIELYEKEIVMFNLYLKSLNSIERNIFISFYYTGNPVKKIIEVSNLKRYEFYDYIRKFEKLYLKKSDINRLKYY